ncbi:MAG: carboxypeptidase-like regulatory domain-containing protein, partial [Bacteroidota bacterium]
MKPQILLLLMLGLLLGPISRAQSPDPLQQAVNLELESMPIVPALDSLGSHLKIRFSYDPQNLPQDKKVEIAEASKSLLQVLDQWLAGTGLRYRLVGKQIVLYRSKPSNSRRINGFIKERGSQEPLPYARVLIAGTKRGAVANQYGYFSLLVERFPVQLVISRLGYQSDSLSLNQAPSGSIDVPLAPQSLQVEVVEIKAEAMLEAEEAGRIVIGPDFIESVPAFLGERDVVKALQYLPGVQRANEGNSGLFVRGGNGDQNLILLDEAPIYNVNHLFGFFSVFNGDAVQNVEFIKGGFPAHYGGRLSSVVAVTTKEGSREKWGAKGAIGLTSSRLVVGGPLLNKKASLLLSARRTYWDLLVRPFTRFNAGQSDPFFFFHDYNTKFTYTPNERDKISASLYSSWDRYGLIERFQDRDEFRTGFNW